MEKLTNVKQAPVINNALAITEKDANQFVVDIGNQAIKILKIPVDDKEKRKKEKRNEKKNLIFNRENGTFHR